MHEESDMYTKRMVMSSGPVLALALAGAMVTANAVASGPAMAVSVHVSSKGLDLNRPADAQRFYWRLQSAARAVCTNGIQVGLQPMDDPQGCIEQALGEAVRAAKAPNVTQIYLANHTLREAAAHGIKAPAQVAAK
jgi:UrcA family protein